jgi:hypothetical protein
VLERDRNCSRENRTGYQVTNEVVRFVLEVAKYRKVHIRYSVLTSGKL